MSTILVLTTVPDARTAKDLARSLVRRRLAACVSMKRGAVSYYRWKGKVERADEVLLTIKTVDRHFKSIQRFIESRHPYELPEIIALPVKKGSPRYLAWLKGACLAAMMALWMPWTAQAAETISIEELKSLQETHADFLLLDARDKHSYDAGHIEGAVLPADEDYYRQMELFQQTIKKEPPDSQAALARSMSAFSRGKPAITYCNDHCGIGRVLMTQLKALGFSDVRVLEPGFQSWEKKGYPVAKAPPRDSGL